MHVSKHLLSFGLLIGLIAAAVDKPHNENSEQLYRKGHSIDQMIAAAADTVRAFDLVHDEQHVRVDMDMLIPIERFAELIGKEPTANPAATSKGKSRQRRKAFREPTSHWPSRTIPYVLAPYGDYTEEEKANVMQAIAHYEKYTCLRYVVRTDEPDYILFKDGDGCSTEVGYVAGKGAHSINLARNCRDVGVIIHEMAHSLGLFHEQNRPDRDDYVKIISENLASESLIIDFQKFSDQLVNTYNVPYDYNSVMHYGPRAFSKDGHSITLQTIDKAFTEKIGLRIGLSFRDMQLISHMFGCGDHCNNTCPGLNDEKSFHNERCECVCSGLSQTDPVRICNQQDVDEQSATASATPDSSCHDSYAKCADWASRGDCKQHAASMQIHCPKSCNMCPSTTVTTAALVTNSSHADESVNHTTTGHTTDVVTDSVVLEPVTIIAPVVANCYDKDKIVCPVLASLKYCQRNDRQMKARCRQSCDLCNSPLAHDEEPRKSHFKVDRHGQSTCKSGWTGQLCDQPICRSYCLHGYCSRPGQCRCFNGWRGVNCNICQVKPGCKKGTCEKPFECNCQHEWTGELCDKKIK